MMLWANALHLKCNISSYQWPCTCAYCMWLGLLIQVHIFTPKREQDDHSQHLGQLKMGSTLNQHQRFSIWKTVSFWSIEAISDVPSALSPWPSGIAVSTSCRTKHRAQVKQHRTSNSWTRQDWERPPEWIKMWFLWATNFSFVVNESERSLKAIVRFLNIVEVAVCIWIHKDSNKSDRPPFLLFFLMDSRTDHTRPREPGIGCPLLEAGRRPPQRLDWRIELKVNVLSLKTN